MICRKTKTQQSGPVLHTVITRLRRISYPSTSIYPSGYRMRINNKYNKHAPAITTNYWLLLLFVVLLLDRYLVATVTGGDSITVVSVTINDDDDISNNDNRKEKHQRGQEMECNADGTCVGITTDDIGSSSTGLDVDQKDEIQPKCGLYMAESSIPNSGLGMFTAKTIQPRERIFYSELVIQTEDPELNTKLRQTFHRNNNDEIDTSADEWLLGNYYWDPVNTFGDYEADEVQSVVPGIGMLANSHTGLVNAVFQPPKPNTVFDRMHDPGAGGITHYHDQHFIANGIIEAGAEIFVEYGDKWFAERKSTLGTIPLSLDFQKANELSKRLWSMIKKTNIKNDQALASDFLDLLVQTAAVGTNDRLYMSLPKTINELEHTMKYGSASLTVPQRVKSTEWLETHGRCLDNIRPQQSTISQAGYGAFATRKLYQGQVVAPMPVVHMHRDQMEVYDTDRDTDEVYRIGTQLLINYVYGHPTSTLLFFPYSPVVNYINHNRSLANVELRWSTLSNHQSSWLDKTPSELLSNADHAGLIMELVALRDIEPNEEIILNYGTDWENAWSEHVQTWKPDPEYEGYVSAAQLNKEIEIISTLEERENNVSINDSEQAMLFNDGSDYIFTACFISDEILDAIASKEGSTDSDDGMIRYKWKDEEELFDSASSRYPCEIIERKEVPAQSSKTTTMTTSSNDDKASVQKQNFYYTAMVDITSSGRKRQKEVMIEDIPRYAIQFVDKAYTSDLCLRNAFRHEIHLPDDMIPTVWRDLV